MVILYGIEYVAFHEEHLGQLIIHHFLEEENALSATFGWMHFFELCHKHFPRLNLKPKIHVLVCQ